MEKFNLKEWQSRTNPSLQAQTMRIDSKVLQTNSHSKNFFASSTTRASIDHDGSQSLQTDNRSSPEPPRSPGLKKEFLNKGKNKGKKLSSVMTREERKEQERLNITQKYTGGT